ncbi:hypothetical protein B484DRAFT_397581 [Ochromonadaceae sp. CCMP2298]|nr:hypothetical protein B484DRAFT_397581 [Ochromonadaceae sp. CCMP2298]
MSVLTSRILRVDPSVMINKLFIFDAAMDVFFHVPHPTAHHSFVNKELYDHRYTVFKRALIQAADAASLAAALAPKLLTVRHAKLLANRKAYNMGK